MKTKNRTYQSIFAEAYKAMHQVNPEHSHSHTVEDWAIENFMDRVFSLGYKGKADKAYKWWIEQNQTGLRPVMVELTPNEIKLFLDYIMDMATDYPDIQKYSTIKDKLEQAADESIVGD